MVGPLAIEVKAGHPCLSAQVVLCSLVGVFDKSLSLISFGKLHLIELLGIRLPRLD